MNARGASGLFVTLWALLSMAFPLQAGGGMIEWALDGSAEGRRGAETFRPTAAVAKSAWVAGVSGKALAIAPGSPVTYNVPVSFLPECALSFNYRLPPAPKKGGAWGGRKLAILRWGDHVLSYELGRRLVFYPESVGARKFGAVTLELGALRDDRFVTLEMGWSDEERCQIFVHGIVATWMRKPIKIRSAGSTVPITLLAGTFDGLRLEPKVQAAGVRYRGALATHRFEAKQLPSYLLFRNRHYWKGKLRRVPGFNGSAGAIRCGEANRRHIYMGLFLGSFRVTEDMYLCGAFFSSNGHVTRTFVRIYPKKLKHHSNYWLRGRIPKAKWHVERTPLSRWGLKPGYLVEGIAFGSVGKSSRWLAADNVTLVRGKDTTPPAKVTGLKMKQTDEGVLLTWQPAFDDVCVADYVVYWSNVPEMKLDENEIVGKTLGREFTHTRIPHFGTYYYAVAARDLFGNTGPASEKVKVEIEE